MIQHRPVPTQIMPLKSFLLFLLCIPFAIQEGRAQAGINPQKPRIVITADPELDDNNSLVRFLLYSNEMEVAGLIYASSGYHWKGDGKGTRWYIPGREYSRFGLDTCPCTSWRWAEDERFIHAAVDAYEKAYPNLIKHSPGYPSPALLRSRIRFGNIAFDGDISSDSPGSEWIKSLILDEQPGQLFLAAWGGQSTIARALRSIEEQFATSLNWESLKKKIERKVVLLPSGDQDDSYANYIRPNWPEIEYRQFVDGPNYGFGAQLRAKPENAIYLTPEWIRNNILERGPLGSLYRVWGDGKQMVKGDKMDYFGIPDQTDESLRKQGYVVWLPVQAKGSWIGEGDDPTYMNMLGNGLRAFEKGFYGGWGGRDPGKQDNRTESAQMSLPAGDTSAAALTALLGTANDRPAQRAGKIPFPDFFAAAQRDFAGRMNWSVTPTYQQANHHPVIRIQGPLEILVSPGATIRLNAMVSDPDGNAVKVLWSQLPVGSFPGKVVIRQSDSLQTFVQIPAEAKPGQTIHIVAEATDSGEPALTRYQRIILTVR